MNLDDSLSVSSTFNFMSLSIITIKVRNEKMKSEMCEIGKILYTLISLKYLMDSVFRLGKFLIKHE